MHSRSIGYAFKISRVLIQDVDPSFSLCCVCEVGWLPIVQAFVAALRCQSCFCIKTIQPEAEAEGVTRRYPWGIQWLVSTHSNFSWGVLSLGSQNSKWQVLTNFSLGGGYSWVVKTQSAKYCPIFHFKGRGGRGYSGIGYSCQNEQKIWHAKLSLALQIISDTMCVETNK